MTESIGQKLREMREAHSLDVEQVAHATRIKVRYLTAIETGDFEALPSAAQARGFVRAYASYIGMDPKPLLDDLSREAPFLSLSPPSAPPRRDETPLADTGQADAIFAEIGERLRNQREILGLSLEDVERHTHLRVHYLKALEAGNIKGLPSPVQGRGMLNNYAGFLGLDSEAVLLRFAEGLQAILSARQAANPRRPSTQRRPVTQVSPIRRLLSVDFLVGGVLVIFLAAFVIWGGIRIAEMRSSGIEATHTPTAPSIAEVLLSNPTATPSLTPMETDAAGLGSISDELDPASETALIPGRIGEESGDNEEGDEPSPTFAPDSSALQVYIMVRQRAWMRVLVDGQVAFEGRVNPGSAHPFSGEESVEVLTGNGAALEVLYNEADIGPLGAFGEVVHRVFTLQGSQDPTPTVTPTSLPTSQATPTTVLDEARGPEVTVTP